MVVSYCGGDGLASSQLICLGSKWDSTEIPELTVGDTSTSVTVVVIESVWQQLLAFCDRISSNVSDIPEC